MNINDLIQNPEKIKEIKDLGVLKTLIQEGKDIIKPYEDIIHEIRKHSTGILEKIKIEDRKKRVIKNFKILENLLSDLDNTFKDVIIDIDEMLVFIGKGGHKYFTRTDLDKIFELNNIDSRARRNDFDKILNFLTENNLLVQMYEYLCPNSYCHDSVITMKGKPTVETLKKEIEEYCDDIENFACDECGEELKLDLKRTQPTMYYAKPDKENC